MKGHAPRLILFLSLALISAMPLTSGPVSLAVKGTKVVLKAGAREATEAATKRAFAKRTEAVIARYGSGTFEHVSDIAARRGIHPRSLVILLEDYGNVLARHRFSEEAILFARKHGGCGVFFLRHPELFSSLKKSVDPLTVEHKVIVQAWRWTDDKAIGGSLKRLRVSLTTAGMNNGRARDFCEDLFIIKARSGKVPTIPKGSELIKGHLNDEVTGIDFFLPEHGKLRAIEFGTGMKPGRGELDWVRIQRRIADFVESRSLDQRINLTQQGFPLELLLAGARIRAPDFPISKYVRREIFANGINGAEVRRAGEVSVNILK